MLHPAAQSGVTSGQGMGTGCRKRGRTLDSPRLLDVFTQGEAERTVSLDFFSLEVRHKQEMYDQKSEFFNLNLRVKSIEFPQKLAPHIPRAANMS